jgi:hypothetical protein
MIGLLRRYILVAAIALAGWTPYKELRAQKIPHSALNLGSTLLHPFDTTAPRRQRLEVGDSLARKTYWLEGALISGAIIGLGAAALAGAACSDKDSGGDDGPCWDNVLLGAAVGFGAGGSLGALVGGLFSKGKPEPPQEREGVR